MKKNLLFISHIGNTYNGADIALLHQMKYLKTLGYNVSVAHMKGFSNEAYNKALAESSINSYPIAFHWWPENEKEYVEAQDDIRSISEIIRIIKEENIDCVISNTVVIPWGAFAAALADKPHVWLTHEVPSDYPLIGNKYSFVANYSNRILASSNNLAEFVNERLESIGVDKKASYFLPFTNTPVISEEQSPEHRLISVNYLDKRKNPLELLRALKVLHDRNIKCTVVFFGNDNENMIPMLSKFAEDNKLADYVQFLTDKDSPWHGVRKSDIFVNTSISETFGLTMIESIKAGVPLIASDAMTALIDLGYLSDENIYKLGDEKDLADKVENFLNNFESALQKCNEIREKVLREQSIEQITKPLVVAIEESSAEHNPCGDLSHFEPTVAYYDKGFSSVYFDNGDGFSDSAKILKRHSDDPNKIDIKVDITPGTKGIRFDPVEERQCVISNLKITSADGRNLTYVLPNTCYKEGESLYFVTDDPQMTIPVKGEETVHIRCDIAFCEGEIVLQLKEKIDKFAELSDVHTRKIFEYESAISEKDNQLLALESHIWAVEHSRSWRITKPLRAVVRGIKKIRIAKLMFKGLKAIRRVGPIKAVKMTRAYLSNRKRMKKLLRDFPADFIDNKNIAVDCEYQNDIDFSEYSPKVKTIAFHLPQFHTFPENDQWWGEGFTEWTNSSKGSPRFDGHYQPRTPHSDIGYYDLSDVEALKKQAELAKRHGIYGFCFYLYWFSGKRLMEKPLDMLLDHPEIDLPFCLCWANENWTRAWDGQTSEVLIAQDYSESDPQQFIDDNKKYFDDSRYIRVNGKPVLIVYNPGHIPNIKSVFASWRKRAEEVGLGEILIWTCQTSNNTAEVLKITDSVDGEVEFPPHNMWFDFLGIRDVELGGKNASLYNYQALVEVISKKLADEQAQSLPVYHTAMGPWDNAARRAENWTTYCKFSSKSFYKWAEALTENSNRVHTEDDNFIFVNAWNEWCEGTYLEPDEKYGYNNINTLSKAICGLSFDVRLNVFTESAAPLSTPRIAVQVHAFYTDLLDEVIENLNRIPVPFDVYVSTDSADKVAGITEKFSSDCNAENIKVDFFGNVGRDVAPLLRQLEPVLSEYDYICHIHTKKTKTGDGYGDYWREYLYRHLFGSSDNIASIINRFEENPQIGLLFPETYPGVAPQATWGGNLLGVKALLKRIGCEVEVSGDAVFPVGDMFWARSAAVKPMFDAHITDFPKEQGQVNATIMHEIERSWVYMARSLGFESEKIFNNTPSPVEYKEQNNVLLYVHFDKENIVSDDDISSLVKMREVSAKIIFVSNSDLSAAEQDKLEGIVDGVLLRPNEGYDFGAWKEIIINEIDSLREYDNVILMNNSVCGPYRDMKSLFAKMQSDEVDFFGVTAFPGGEDTEYLKMTIPRHLQSYFIILSQKVVADEAFINFWENLEVSNDMKETVKNGETQFTKALSDRGFTYKTYIEDSELLCALLSSFSLVYDKPYQMLLAGFPFVKKKYSDYASEEEAAKVKHFLEQITI